MRMVPADFVPESAIRHTDDAIGFLVLRSLTAGQMVLNTDVVSPTVAGGVTAFTMDKGKVAFAFPADDLLTSNRVLKAGDHVDVLFSIEVKAEVNGSERLMTFNALQNLEVAAIIDPSDLQSQASQQSGGSQIPPRAVIFTLDPQDALILKYLKDMGGTVDIVLRAPDSKEQFSPQPVNQDYLLDRYQMRLPEAP